MARIENTANTLAARFNDDGQRRTDADGIDIDEAAGVLSANEYGYDGAVVYEFADGSALAVTDGGWDTVQWDADDGVFYAVEPWGARNASGWRFPAA
jgi:hypothetical protein